MIVEESNQNVFLIEIDASRFSEFEISEFEIARVDCNLTSVPPVKLFDSRTMKAKADVLVAV